MGQGVVGVADGLGCVGVCAQAGLGDAALGVLVQVVVALLGECAGGVIGVGGGCGLPCAAARRFVGLAIAAQPVAACGALVQPLQGGAARQGGFAVVGLGAVAVGVPGVAHAVGACRGAGVGDASVRCTGTDEGEGKQRGTPPTASTRFIVQLASNAYW